MQSKMMSTLEALANIIVGQIYAIVAYMVLLPLFGYEATLSKSIGLTTCFCILGFIRSYVLRRFFDWINYKRVL